MQLADSRTQNKDILKNDIFYQSMNVNQERLYDVFISWNGRLLDFPGNATIYNAKLSLEDKQGNILNVTSGAFLASVAILQTMMENLPLEDCPGALRGLPIGLGIFPHRWIDTVQNGGKSLFTAADGSQPNAGIWSKNLAEMILTVNGISLSPDRAIPSVARLDMDYVDGKPEVRTLRKELTLDLSSRGLCGRPLMEKMKGEGT